jgi:predicted Zn-ribbon and HTH transcriptional regulator
MTMGEKIIATLQKSPNGMTSKELAETLGKQQDSVSACAYKMFIAGKVERNSERQQRPMICNPRRVMVCDTFRWRAKG